MPIYYSIAEIINLLLKKKFIFLLPEKKNLIKKWISIFHFLKIYKNIISIIL